MVGGEELTEALNALVTDEENLDGSLPDILDKKGLRGIEVVSFLEDMATVRVSGNLTLEDPRTETFECLVSGFILGFDLGVKHASR